MDSGLVNISFPGIGIGEFTVKKAAITISDGWSIYWYGIVITLGMIFAFTYAAWRAKQEKIKFDDVIDISIFTIVIGVIGARLYYVLTTLDSGNYHSFIDVIAIWEGGLAIYGGIIGGAIALYVTCRVKKIDPFRMVDAAVPGVAIAQAMGRWGNFFNGEAFGGIVSEGSPLYFMRMGLQSAQTRSRFGTTDMVFVHPTFLYESLWNIAGFVLMNLLYKKKKFNGQIALTYFAWYGFGRMFIEGLRMDSLMVGPFRISQVVGGVCFIVCSGLMIYFLVRVKKQEQAGTYKPVFEKAAEETERPTAGIVTEEKADEETQTVPEEYENKPEESESKPEESENKPEEVQNEIKTDEGEKENGTDN